MQRMTASVTSGSSSTEICFQLILPHHLTELWCSPPPLPEKSGHVTVTFIELVNN